MSIIWKLIASKLCQGHTDWGADEKTLLCLYWALVRYELDYGCGAASNNILKKLDPIHHQGLRIALGAFRTSPCNKPLCESTRNVFEKQMQETVYELCFKTKKLVLIIQLVFLNHRTQNSLKNPAWLHLLAFEFYHCLRIQRLRYDWWHHSDRYSSLESIWTSDLFIFDKV